MRKRFTNTEGDIVSSGENITASPDAQKKTPVKLSKFELFKEYVHINSKAIKVFSVGIICFVIILGMISNVKMGYVVVLGNEKIGYVKEKDKAVDIVKAIENELSVYTEEDIDLSSSFSPAFAPNSSFKSDDEIEEVIKSTLEYYTDACAVYVDDTLAFACKDEQSAKDTVSAFEKYVLGDGEILESEILNKIEYKNEKVVATLLVSGEDAMETILGTNSKEGLYTIVEGDTLWSIGIENDIATDHLMELNNIDSEIIKPGQVLRIKDPTPLISIEYKEKISYIEYHPYETIYEHDSSMTKGRYKTVQEGSKGETAIEAIVTNVNNHETNREITKSEVICEPVNEIIKVGTKPKPKTAATGIFGRPISGGYVSSAFGNRSRGYHTGIDWAISYGTPIYAADGGTVTSAGWGGGYGYMIKISHGNGYETLYAHCSKLAVKYGQKVAKGQVIGYVGSTGNSTGPHLHFEIRKNGQYLNPANYV